MSPLFRGIATLLLVAAAGRFSTPQVWGLALIGGFSFYDLGRREDEEAGPADWTSTAMQVGFLLILCGAAWDNRSWPSLAVPGGPEAIGLGMIALGIWLRKRTHVEMGHHFTVRIQSGADHELVQTGPFRFLRHPSYTSLALVAVGTALSMRSEVALLAFLFVWLPAAGIRITREEAFLTRRFGGAYEEYCARTWRLVPLVF